MVKIVCIERLFELIQNIPPKHGINKDFQNVFDKALAWLGSLHEFCF